LEGVHEKSPNKFQFTSAIIIIIIKKMATNNNKSAAKISDTKIVGSGGGLISRRKSSKQSIVGESSTSYKKNYKSARTIERARRDSLHFISEHQENNCASNSSERKSLAKISQSKFFRFLFPYQE